MLPELNLFWLDFAGTIHLFYSSSSHQRKGMRGRKAAEQPLVGYKIPQARFFRTRQFILLWENDAGKVWVEQCRSSWNLLTLMTEFYLGWFDQQMTPYDAGNSFLPPLYLTRIWEMAQNVLIRRNLLSCCKPRQTFRRNDCTALISRVYGAAHLVTTFVQWLCSGQIGQRNFLTGKPPKLAHQRWNSDGESMDTARAAPQKKRNNLTR
jgi:hypothetical protein